MGGGGDLLHYWDGWACAMYGGEVVSCYRKAGRVRVKISFRMGREVALVPSRLDRVVCSDTVERGMPGL